MDKVKLQNLDIKLKEIFNLKEENETKYDRELKQILKIIIGENLESSVKLFKDEGIPLLCKIIELIHYLFLQKKEKRETIYASQIGTIHGEPIDQLNKEIFYAQAITFEFKNDNFKELYKSIYLQNISDTFIINFFGAIINLAFFLDCEELIKYFIFTLIVKNYMPSSIAGFFHLENNQLNIIETNSVKLMIDLFNKQDKKDEITVMKSLIILRYNLFREIMINNDFEKILKGIENATVKIKNRTKNNSNLYWEKVILILKEEIEKVDIDNKMKRKKIKEEKRIRIISYLYPINMKKTLMSIINQKKNKWKERTKRQHKNQMKIIMIKV